MLLKSAFLFANLATLYVLLHAVLTLKIRGHYGRAPHRRAAIETT